VLVAFGRRQFRFRRSAKCFFADSLADEHRFSSLRSPRFVRDAAERHPRGVDLSILHVERGGHADERKRIARAIAHLQIMRAGRERNRRQIDRCD